MKTNVHDAQPVTRFSLFSTPLGECGIAWRGDAVVATHLPESTAAETAARLTARTNAIQGTPPPAVERAVRSITALLEGAKTDLTFITCDFLRTDSFALKVYDLTRTIPPGETLTYGAIAARLGGMQLARRVGQALGRNPIPIIVPCHRVVGAGGRLTGFSAPGGIETKLRMLAIEGASIGEPPTLFGDLPFAVAPRE